MQHVRFLFVKEANAVLSTLWSTDPHFVECHGRKCTFTSVQKFVLQLERFIGDEVDLRFDEDDYEDDMIYVKPKQRAITAQWTCATKLYLFCFMMISKIGGIVSDMQTCLILIIVFWAYVFVNVYGMYMVSLHSEADAREYYDHL